MFEFVATIREGNIARHKFLHDSKIQGRKFNLMDRVYLKNDKPRVGVSKKLKSKFEGNYTIVAILEAANGEETTEIYKIKPDGRGRTKTVSASKLKRVSGPVYKERVTKEKLDNSKHVEEAIERVVEEGRTVETTIGESEDKTEDRSIREQVDEIIEMLEAENEGEQIRERDALDLDLSWEEDPGFAVEVTVENDKDYQPNYYFKKKLAEEPVENSSRPIRNRKKPERLNYE